MGKFNSAKQFIGQIFGGKVSPTITKVKPNVGSPSKSALNKQIQKTKASGAKLKQTLFESQNKAFKGDDFTFSPSKAGKGKQPRDKRMGGGFMGKRMGYKLGTKKKSNVEKIKKAFGSKKSLGMQSVIYGLDKNPKITAADPKAKFIAAANKKTKKKVI